MSNSAGQSGNSTAFAFIAEGKLFTFLDGAVRPVTSTWMEQRDEQESRRRQLHSWKDGSFGWKLSMNPTAAMFGGQAPPPVAPVFRSVAANGTDLVYIIQTPHTGGLFRQQRQTGEEARLLHQRNLRAADISCAADGRLLLSVPEEEGLTAHIGLIEEGRSGITLVTDGDCVDEAPSWIDGQNAFVYQSAGIGRDAHGNFWALGPRRIERLDLDRGRLETLLENDDFDYLTPRQLRDGTLYYIRRPFHLRQRPPVWKTMLWALASPFIFIHALFHVVTGLAKVFRTHEDPLQLAGGPQPSPMPRHLMVYGQIVTAAGRTRRRSAAAPPRAPSDWVLMRRDRDGSEHPLLRGALAFDVDAQGACVASDGSSIYQISPDGTTTTVHTASLVEHIRLIGPVSVAAADGAQSLT